ncbi:MAG: tetratricopeptide repeat protein [Halofilum sp. (in: g-proteobacteria)]|nr:tetratricopeptide repeat protein [Halofilum sp. (in: g-proteobacteria)]
MSRALQAFVLAVLAGMAGPALADQDDPRLDGLFARLQQVSDPAVGERLTRRIWTLWRRIDDPEIAAAMERGARALAGRDHERAESIYTDVVERAPGYAEGWNKRATARYLLGRHARAAADIRRALALEPRHFGALAGLGLVYMEIGNDRAALEAFRAALALNPHLEGTRENIELLRRRLGEEDS